MNKLKSIYFFIFLSIIPIRSQSINLTGEIFDVAVDLRKKSKTFMKYFGTNLSEKNKLFELELKPGDRGSTQQGAMHPPTEKNAPPNGKIFPIKSVLNKTN